MAEIATLKDVIAGTPRRVDSAERTRLRVLVHPETYAWLSSIAGEHGIGGALDVMAEIHRVIEKAAHPWDGIST
jgi:hypothetical protein